VVLRKTLETHGLLIGDHMRSWLESYMKK
jgi:hypothetical protein